MNRPPTAATSAGAARASFWSTLARGGASAKVRRISGATAVTPATVAASTRPAVNGASPKFSTSSASIPPSTSARASARAASITRAIEPSQRGLPGSAWRWTMPIRSEEHTSELQSRLHLVCRLLLEKKKKNKNILRREEKVTNEIREEHERN